MILMEWFMQPRLLRYVCAQNDTNKIERDFREEREDAVLAVSTRQHPLQHSLEFRKERDSEQYQPASPVKNLFRSEL